MWKKKISKYIGKKVNFLEYFHMNLVFISVVSGSITIVSFTSAIGAPVWPITLFITISFTWTNGFVKLFLSKVKDKKK